MKKASLLLFVVLAAAIAIWYVPLQAAVRPPKLEYQRLVLPNGMVVILHQDKSTPIVHVELWYHVGAKNEKPGRTGFPISSSPDVQGLAQRRARAAHLDHCVRRGQANAYTNEDTPCLANHPGAISAVGDVDGSRPHGLAADRERPSSRSAKSSRKNAACASRTRRSGC